MSSLMSCLVSCLKPCSLSFPLSCDSSFLSCPVSFPFLSYAMSSHLSCPVIWHIFCPVVYTIFCLIICPVLSSVICPMHIHKIINKGVHFSGVHFSWIKCTNIRCTFLLIRVYTSRVYIYRGVHFSHITLFRCTYIGVQIVVYNFRVTAKLYLLLIGNLSEEACVYPAITVQYIMHHTTWNIEKVDSMLVTDTFECTKWQHYNRIKR